MLKELYTAYKIIKWHKKTFPNITYESQREHLISEMSEYMEAFDKYTKRHTKTNQWNVNIERTDVIISAINMLRFPETLSLIDTKMIINKKRNWNKEKGRHE